MEYNNVVSTLLLDYPFLKDYHGSAVSHVHAFLLFVIMNSSFVVFIIIFMYVALILY